jgi:hypothetical protein
MSDESRARIRLPIDQGGGDISLERAFMELTAGSVDYHAALPVSQEA